MLIFPPDLLEAVSRWDPAALLIGSRPTGTDATPLVAIFLTESSVGMRVAGLDIIRRKLRGKNILHIAGGADPLAPYSCSEPFLSWLKKAIAPDGCLSGESVSLDVIVEQGVGHEMTPNAAKQVNQFVDHHASQRCSGSGN